MREPERTVLWSADSVQPNNTSIELNDSIDNYDELIYYGSATRTYCPCVMTHYPVVSGQLNLGGPFFYGVWTTDASYDLCNGTQMFLSGNSGFVGSSYYWGKQNNGTAYEAALTNNRTSDVRPYKIVGLKYPKNDDRTVIWSSDHTDTIYNTNIQLSEPVTHFKSIEVLGSGYEASNVGCRHTSKNIYNTQPRIMGCDAWAYTPWKMAEKHNLVIGQEMRLSGNSGHIGSGYFMGMGNQTTAWAAGKWTTDYQFSATAPYKIFGIDRKKVRKLTLLPTTGGTQSASETSGYEYDQITMSNTPDEGWYFSGYNVTGATVNGNVITLQDQDASVQAGFTDQAYTITYQNDGHGTVTGPATAVPNSTVTLTTAYNTYYRFSGYQVTGGTINGNTLTVTGPCTVKAVFKANAFTATGTFAYSNKTQNNNPTTGNYNATLKAFTGSKPSNWPATNANWNVSNASAYNLTWNTKVSMTAIKGSPASTITGYTQLRIGGTNKKQVGAGGGKLTQTITITNTGSNTTQGQPSLYCWNSAYYTTGGHGWTACSPNGWTATGYAP